MARALGRLIRIWVCRGEPIQRDTMASGFQAPAGIGQAITSLVGIRVAVWAMRFWNAPQLERSWSQSRLFSTPSSTGTR